MGVSVREQSCSDTKLQCSLRGPKGLEPGPPSPACPELRAGAGKGLLSLRSQQCSGEPRRGRLRVLHPSQGMSAQQHCLSQQSAATWLPLWAPVCPWHHRVPRATGMAPSCSLCSGRSKAHPSVSQSRWELLDSGSGTVPARSRPGQAELHFVTCVPRVPLRTVRCICLTKKSMGNVVLIFCPVNKAQNPAVTGTLVALVSLFSL